MARDFDGTDDRVDYGDIAMDGVALCNISMWVNTDVNTDFLCCFSKWGTGAADRIEISLGGTGVGSNTNFLFIINAGNGRTTTNLATIGTWRHLFMAYDGGQAVGDDRVKAWVDGTLQTLTYINGTLFPTTLPTNTGAAWIGGRNIGGAYWNGKIAEFAIWTGNPGGMTPGDAAAFLGKGYSAGFLRKNGLLYSPVVGRTSPEVEWWTGTGGAVTGAVAFPHPKIIYPTSPIALPKSSGTTPPPPFVGAGGLFSLMGVGT